MLNVNQMNIQKISSNQSIVIPSDEKNGLSCDQSTASHNLFKIGDQRMLSKTILTTTGSSSGSDPIASPSNELMSDTDIQHLKGMFPTIPGHVNNNGAIIIGNDHNSVQARLSMLEKHFMLQKELLSRQFEEQCRLLDSEQQTKMQEYLTLMLKKQQDEEMLEMKKKFEDEQMMKIKNKRKTDESAVASTAVKIKLRQCLLNKSQKELQNSTDSPPDFEHWSTQHSSLEQQSPPSNTKWSPPLHILSRFEEEYPLRKTVSEPSLKMKSCKLSLRQRVMEGNNQLIRRREMYKKKSNAILDHDSSPNSPTPFDSHGSSIDDSKCQNTLVDVTLKEYTNNLNLQLYNKTGFRKHSETLSSYYGSLPLVGTTHFPILSSDKGITECLVGGQLNLVQKSFDYKDVYEAKNKEVVSSGLSTGLPLSNNNIFQNKVGSNNLTESYVQALIMASKISLPRTRSEPIPLPIQLLLQQHIYKQQEISHRDSHKYLIKQKLLYQSGTKKFMENVDESVEGHILPQDSLGGSMESEEEVDVRVENHANKQSIKSKKNTNSLENSNLTNEELSTYIVRPNLERGQSCPVTCTANDHLTHISVDQKHITGLTYDNSMLRHMCLCQNNKNHPENPERIKQIWERFKDNQLLEKCKLVKSRRAMKEELQTCHSETYVHMYGSSQRHRAQAVLEKYAPRFCQLGCGGIGVDADTFWNDQSTTTAARIAVGCVIELSYQVAMGDINNGFAIVRPPGHHAEDTQAMGFCYFNSIGIATKQLLEKLNYQKILLIDWDVHHGNSTQQLFYSDPRVLFISIHRYDNGNFFPGTGDPSECGINKGLGFNVNIGWSGPPMGDAEYMAAFRTIVMPIARDFQPELIMVSAGFDGALGHPAPLGGYNLTPSCFSFMTSQLLTLANKKVVLVLEGGYELLPLVNSAEACLHALLEDPIELPTFSELCRPPCEKAIESLINTINYQIQYWPSLKAYTNSLGWSYKEAEEKMMEIPMDISTQSICDNV